MEARILELLQHPEDISTEDILLLQNEISKYPYMQSLRTLQLSAVYHFESEQYHKELTKTAAYTTDKKILYQFINRKKIEDKKEAAKLKKITLAKSEEIQGEPNEDIATFQKAEKTISETSPLENLPFKIEEEPVSNDPFKTRQEDLNFTKETVLEQFDIMVGADETIEIKPAEISFNGFDSFLPDVKFTIPTAKKESSTAIENPVSEVPHKNDVKEEVNLENTQPFEIKEEPVSVVKIETPIVKEEAPKTIEKEAPIAEKVVEIISEPEVHTHWKPMSFTASPLDSQIIKQEPEKPKSSETKLEEKIEKATKIEEIKPELVEEVVKEEVPQAEVPVVEMKGETIAQPKIEENISSNIPGFVNTWQNWLKIDRTESPKIIENQPERVIEKKADIIDRFIEDNPRISQLKEESSFVIKEKNDDISHLMTETLAKLYIEQKLYTKAIKAYEVLLKKHPEKLQEFKDKIQEIKALRQNK